MKNASIATAWQQEAACGSAYRHRRKRPQAVFQTCVYLQLQLSRRWFHLVQFFAAAIFQSRTAACQWTRSGSGLMR